MLHEELLGPIATFGKGLTLHAHALCQVNIPPRFKASGKHGETYKHATAMECLVGLHIRCLACLRIYPILDKFQ